MKRLWSNLEKGQNQARMRHIETGKDSKRLRKILTTDMLYFEACQNGFHFQKYLLSTACYGI